MSNRVENNTISQPHTPLVYLSGQDDRVPVSRHYIEQLTICPAAIWAIICDMTWLITLADRLGWADSESVSTAAGPDTGNVASEGATERYGKLKLQQTTDNINIHTQQSQQCITALGIYYSLITDFTALPAQLTCTVTMTSTCRVDVCW